MEIWKDIRGFEGYYQVSSLGNVKSLHRSKLRVICKDRKGYNILSLYKRGYQKTFKVHRLVAECFIPNPDNKPEVNHIDGNKQNNEVSNLEWCTPSENQKHAFKLGLQETYKGEEHIKAKLTNEQAVVIKYLRKDKPNFYTFQNLANRYSVSITTIHNILNDKRYKHAQS